MSGMEGSPKHVKPRTPNRAEERLLALDQLRAFAVFLVLCHHAAYRFTPSKSDLLANTLKHAGWIGVDIFFVISGFMISKILLRDMHQGDLKGFFVRRVYRILPLLLAAVALFAVVAIATGREADKLPLLWSPALMMNGWTIPFIGYGQVPFTIAWSLSVEETAYALLGFSCLWFLRGLRTMLISLLLVSIAVRLSAVFSGWMGSYELYFFVPARLDGIALGGLGALGYFGWVANQKHTSRWAGLLTIGLIWSFQFVKLSEPIMPLIGYAAFALVCGIWVTSLSTQPSGTSHTARPRPWTWPSRATAHFGQLSYFVYLFHIFVLEGIRLLQGLFQIAPLNYWLAVLLATLITYACANLSWLAFEAPLIQRGREHARRALAQRTAQQKLPPL